MDRDTLNTICRELPGAELSDPWGGGHDAWKVGGKMFACVGIQNRGVSVKTEGIDAAAFLIDLERAERAPYFHRSWILVPWGLVGDDELRDRVLTSYRIVRSGLTKKLQVTLDPPPDD
ncbi:MAG: MmcQ/YjbR family DNA-binding protein [Pseudomonadota bacterium]